MAIYRKPCKVIIYCKQAVLRLATFCDKVKALSSSADEDGRVSWTRLLALMDQGYSSRPSICLTGQLRRLTRISLVAYVDSELNWGSIESHRRRMRKNRRRGSRRRTEGGGCLLWKQNEEREERRKSRK